MVRLVSVLAWTRPERSKSERWEGDDDGPSPVIGLPVLVLSLLLLVLGPAAVLPSRRSLLCCRASYEPEAVCWS